MAGDHLEPILARKRGEVADLARRAADLRAAAADMPPPRDWTGALRRPGEVAVIAEMKRKAPSAGPLSPDLDPSGLAKVYGEAGAAALSVLTDAAFGGALADLVEARGAVSLPVLRKDFVIDPVQLWEARAEGADAVLLIVRALSQGGLRELLAAAEAAGVATLVEVHDEAELERALEVGAEVVGINNRDLSTFQTDLDVTRRLVSQVPGDRVVVSESGIQGAEQVRDLGARGVDAVLVGTALVSQREPGVLAKQLVGQERIGRP